MERAGATTLKGTPLTLVGPELKAGDAAPDFSLVECAYGPVLNVIEKAGFSFAEFPRVQAYLDAIRARIAWKTTPKLPGL